jgi:hypothetical protein
MNGEGNAVQVLQDSQSSKKKELKFFGELPKRGCQG